MLKLVWVNPNPKRSRKKFRAALRVVHAAPLPKKAA